MIAAEEAFRFTNRGNLVAVVTNGTAVLGLGNIGPLAGKPVMEGKAVLFKRFADIDVFDLEIDAVDPEDVIRFCELLEPTVGGINLAVLYGLGLIVVAFLLALLYDWLCRAPSPPAPLPQGERGESGRRREEGGR